MGHRAEEAEAKNSSPQLPISKLASSILNPINPIIGFFCY